MENIKDQLLENNKHTTWVLDYVKEIAFTIGLRMLGIGQSVEVDFGAHLSLSGLVMMERKKLLWGQLKS